MAIAAVKESITINIAPKEVALAVVSRRAHRCCRA